MLAGSEPVRSWFELKLAYHLAC